MYKYCRSYAILPGYNLPRTELKLSFSASVNINPPHTRVCPLVVVLNYHPRDPSCRGAVIPRAVRTGQRLSFVELALSTLESYSLFTFTFSVEVKVKSAAAECSPQQPGPVVVDARAVAKSSVGASYTVHCWCNAIFEGILKQF